MILALLLSVSTVLAPKPVVLDVDPGIDDALALLLALRSPELDVRAVTVVAGNVEVDLGVTNALEILELAGRADVPVARGADSPLLGASLNAKNVHGANGLGGVVLPKPVTEPYDGSALDLLAETLRASSEPVTLLPVGPLTNIALFLKVHPELRPKIREIVIMGGTASVGTVLPTVSFNIFNDPEAAAIVYGSGLPITMVGLDVTLKTVLTPERLAGLELESPIARFVAGVVAFQREEREAEGVVIHDALAVGVAIDPSFVRTELLPVGVETRGELTRGQTVVDRRADATWRQERPVTTRVALEVDADRFLDFFLARLLAPVRSR